MSTQPHTIGFDMPVKTALNMMRENRIRHLPVENGGRLVGIVTDRDIKLVSAYNHDETYKIEDIMTAEPYTVRPQAPVNEVVLEMAEHKYGCAVVQQENGKVVGIFTANDGLRVLGEMLEGYFKQ